MTDSTEQLVEALSAAAVSFVEEDGDDYTPNYLYVAREDGKWFTEFRCSEDSSPLAGSMTEWKIGDYAAKDFVLVQSGNAREVADEIVKGWDPEWDD